MKNGVTNIVAELHIYVEIVLTKTIIVVTIVTNVGQVI